MYRSLGFAIPKTTHWLYYAIWYSLSSNTTVN